MMFVSWSPGSALFWRACLATGYGISIKEFSTGNTLIITGVMAVCTGAMMLALWIGGQGTEDDRAPARRR